MPSGKKLQDIHLTINPETGVHDMVILAKSEVCGSLESSPFPQLHPVTYLIQIHKQLNYSWSAEVHRCI